LEERMKLYQPGEYFTPDPGINPPYDVCQTCGATLEQTSKNIDGPTSTVAAMSGSTRLHDVWSCPEVGQDWHDQAYALKRSIKETPSLRLQKILEEELSEIVATKTATKKVSRY
jgi:hypothetical protein